MVNRSRQTRRSGARPVALRRPEPAPSERLQSAAVMTAELGAGPHAVPTRSAGLGCELRRPGLQSVRPPSPRTHRRSGPRARPCATQNLNGLGLSRLGLPCLPMWTAAVGSQWTRTAQTGRGWMMLKSPEKTVKCSQGRVEIRQEKLSP